jgi:hypothetical protein
VAVILPMPATWHRECYTEPRGRGVIYRALALEGAAEPHPYLWFALRRADAPPGALANRSTDQRVN